MSKTSKMFLAPEIMNPEMKSTLLGDKIDAFAIGVMLFISLFGRPPFGTSSRLDHYYQFLFSQNSTNKEKFFRAHRGIQFDDDLKDLFSQIF